MRRVEKDGSGPAKERPGCGSCTLHRLCLPLGIGRDELDRLARIVRRHRPSLRRGEYLFHAGDRFRAIHVLRTGSAKTVRFGREGTEHVTGFHLPGELIGLDAIASGRHPGAVQALERTAVCEIAYADLEPLSRRIPGLQRQLLRLMSGEIRRDRDMTVMLSSVPADERLAALVLNLADRFEARGFSCTRLRLSMTRAEIGSYLGLAMETVSRILSRLQRDGLIRVRRREVTIINRAALAGRIRAPLSLIDRGGPARH